MLPHRGLVHVCVLQVTCEGDDFPGELLCHLPFESPRPAERSCCKECTILSVPSLRIVFLMVFMLLFLLWNSYKSRVGYSAGWPHALAAPAASIHLWELCRPARCVLHRDAGWQSKTPLPSIFKLVLQIWLACKEMQGGLPAGLPKAFERCWWHHSLQSFLKPGDLLETKLSLVFQARNSLVLIHLLYH